MARTKNASYGVLTRRTSRAASPPPEVPAPVPPPKPKLKLNGPKKVDRAGAADGKAGGEVLKKGRVTKVTKVTSASSTSTANKASHRGGGYRKAAIMNAAQAREQQEQQRRSVSTLSEVSSSDDGLPGGVVGGPPSQQQQQPVVFETAPLSSVYTSNEGENPRPPQQTQQRLERASLSSMNTSEDEVVHERGVPQQSAAMNATQQPRPERTSLSSVYTSDDEVVHGRGVPQQMAAMNVTQQQPRVAPAAPAAPVDRSNASSPLSEIDSGDEGFADFGADNIQVRPKMQAIVIDADEDEDDPMSDIEKLDKQLAAKNPDANRPWARSGKQPMRDRASTQQAPVAVDEDPEPVEDEDIDEGEIDYNDHSPSEDALDFMDDGADDADVIELSSDEENGTVNVKKKKKSKERKNSVEQNELALKDRPWKIEGFDRALRESWETMYCNVEMKPLSGSWDLTEDYQCEKDKEMLRYLQDFPLNQWVIPQETANQAYVRLHERSRWRALGIRIYGQQRMPEYVQPGTPPGFVRSQDPRHNSMPMPGNVNMNAYPRQPSMSGPPGSRPPSVPQQQMPYRAPPNGQAMGPPLTPNQQMPPPQNVLRSQPHAMPTNVPPTQGTPGMPGQHQHQHIVQRQMIPPPPFGHPSAVGGAYGAPQGMPYHFAQHPQMSAGPNGAPMQPYPYGYYMPQNPPPGMMLAGMPPHGHGPVPAAPQPKTTTRKKKETPLPTTPPPPPPTPPYAVVGKPVERKKFNKTGKRNTRKQAEAEIMPWHRDIDFKMLRDNATWDISEYDPKILDEMAEVRRMNMPVIQRLDEELAEKQKASRNKKKGTKGSGANDETPSGDNAMDLDGQNSADGTPRPRRGGNPNIGGDPYYSGNFSFATEADRQRALLMSCKTPDQLIEKAEEKSVSMDLCKEIRICWNPGKKGTTQELVQASFRVYDTIITREQYDTTLILTKRAAECLVDFCPDMLWRECLLRIVSEAGYGNKDVRDRFCYNGCYADKATVTKRIAAALGQKQLNNPKKRERQLEAMEAAAKAEAEAEAEGSKFRRRGPAAKVKGDRYLEGEEEWHDRNKIDMDNYTAFFGKRVGARRKPKIGEKRRAGEESEEPGDEGSPGGSEDAGRVKRAKTGESEMSPEASSELSEVEDSEDEDEEGEEGGEEENDDDAVSEQSSGVLDEIED